MHTDIIATLGPASQNPDTLSAMLDAGATIIRLNYSWIPDDGANYVSLIRTTSQASRKPVAILADLPGRRVQEAIGHTFDPSKPVLTERDIQIIKAAVAQNLDYIALSFIANGEEVESCAREIRSLGSTQRIIAKIERPEAVNDVENILDACDGIMVARGDLGDTMPLEELPFAQLKLVEAAREAHKPVIVATQMLLSMTHNERPTRAEVTDVATAILQGATGVMLSEESASGEHPIEAVRMMARIATQAEAHLAEREAAAI